MNKICRYCEKNFEARNSAQKYCSDECFKNAQRLQARNRYYIKVENNLNSAEVVEKICPICGKKFETKLVRRKYCSDRCQKISISRWGKDEATEEIQRREEKEARLKKWIDEARVCGMSYGKYRAAVELFGQTFEELRLQ